MIYYVDIDDTICTWQKDGRYELAEPFTERIEHINRLYDLGHEVVYWTARGSRTGMDWTDITTKQLKEWGCKYHELKLGKPAYDVFIDDKAYNSNKYFGE